MDDLKQAYQTMGLEESASKEEVEKRYTTLMKRDRARSKQHTGGWQEEGLEFAQVTEAYRLILAHEDRKITDAFNEQEYGKYKGMAKQAQKFDHFWRYYKVHTFGAIALIALIIYGVNAYIDNREHQRYLASLPPIDVSVSFFGTFVAPDNKDNTEEINSSMLQSFPDWQRIDSNILFVPQDDMNQYAYLQKAVVTLFSENPDIYLMDRWMFEWVGGQGVLLSLDDKPEITSLLSDDVAMKLAIQNDQMGMEPEPEIEPEVKIYGVDLADSQLAKDLPLMWRELIVGIRANTKNPEKAVRFIETYLKTIPQS